MINAENYERMGSQWGGGAVNSQLASRIADVMEHILKCMKPEDRSFYDLTVTDQPQKLVTFDAKTKIDDNDLYSASYEWLVMFRDFCRWSRGFGVS